MVSRRTSRCSGRSPSAPAAERQIVRQTWCGGVSSDLSEAPVRQESTFGFPDFVVAYSAGRNFAWTASPDAQKTRSMIAVSRRVDSRSWSRRTSRCSGRSPSAPAAERQIVGQTGPQLGALEFWRRWRSAHGRPFVVTRRRSFGLWPVAAGFCADCRWH